MKKEFTQDQEVTVCLSDGVFKGVIKGVFTYEPFYIIEWIEKPNYAQWSRSVVSQYQIHESVQKPKFKKTPISATVFSIVGFKKHADAGRIDHSKYNFYWATGDEVSDIKVTKEMNAPSWASMVVYYHD